MSINREDVLAVLGKITEPDLKNDLVSLNLIEDLQINERQIQVAVKISNPALHARKRMQEAIEFNLKRVFGQDISIASRSKG